MHEQWEKMPPEERAKRRQEMRDHWEKMTPEERKKFRESMGGPGMGPGMGMMPPPASDAAAPPVKK